MNENVYPFLNTVIKDAFIKDLINIKNSTDRIIDVIVNEPDYSIVLLANRSQIRRFLCLLFPEIYKEYKYKVFGKISHEKNSIYFTGNLFIKFNNINQLRLKFDRYMESSGPKIDWEQTNMMLKLRL